MKKVITLICISTLAACAATSKFAPTADEVPLMQARISNITYDEAMQGYKLYAANCSNCHRLHNPTEYTAAKWNEVLPEMFDKAKLSNNNQQLLIRNYLAAKAR